MLKSAEVPAQSTEQSEESNQPLALTIYFPETKFFLTLDIGGTNLKKVVAALRIFDYGGVIELCQYDYEHQDIPDLKSQKQIKTDLAEYSFTTIDAAALWEYLSRQAFNEDMTLALTGANNTAVVVYEGQIVILPERPNIKLPPTAQVLEKLAAVFQDLGYDQAQIENKLNVFKKKDHYLIRAFLAIAQDAQLRQKLFDNSQEKSSQEISLEDLELMDLQTWILQKMGLIEPGSSISDQNLRSMLVDPAADPDQQALELKKISEALLGITIEPHQPKLDQEGQARYFNGNDLTIEIRFLEMLKQELEKLSGPEAGPSRQTVMAGALDTVFKMILVGEQDSQLAGQIENSSYMVQPFGAKFLNWSKIFWADLQNTTTQSHFIETYQDFRVKAGHYDYPDLLMWEFLRGEFNRQAPTKYLFYPLGTNFGKLYQLQENGSYQLLALDSVSQIQQKFTNEADKNEAMLAVSLGTAFLLTKSIDEINHRAGADKLVLYGGLMGNGQRGWPALYQVLIKQNNPDLEIITSKEYEGAAQAIGIVHAATNLLKDEIEDGADLDTLLPKFDQIPDPGYDQDSLAALAEYRRAWSNHLDQALQHEEILGGVPQPFP